MAGNIEIGFKVIKKDKVAKAVCSLGKE